MKTYILIGSKSGGIFDDNNKLTERRVNAEEISSLLKELIEKKYLIRPTPAGFVARPPKRP
jgi:hypothetical protein